MYILLEMCDSVGYMLLVNDRYMFYLLWSVYYEWKSTYWATYSHWAVFGALIIHAYDATEAFTSKGYIYIIHAYEFTIVLRYKPMVLWYLFLDKFREMKWLIQAVFAWKYRMIYIFKDEIKYVIGMEG